MRRKLLSIILALTMALGMLPAAALAEEATGAGPIKVGGTSYSSFSDAVNAAEPDGSGVITYEISGKVDVTATGWVQVAKAGLTGPTKVEFVGKTGDAEICITQGEAILADQNYDIDVSFEALKLTKLNPQWAGDFGHSTNYFTCWLRNTNAAENTVTYKNCTFPNGVCNNQYGKTVFDSCQFTNATSGKFNLWNYGGNTEVKNSTFIGTRGIKMYNEGTLPNPPSIEIKNTNFTGMTEKAAIVVSKAANVTLNTVDATDCTKGLLQKDIEGSTGEQKVTIEANGTGISGGFNITAEMSAEAAKNEFNITAGMFTGGINNDYLAPGANFDATTGEVKMSYVAKIGDTEYPTLDDAITAAKDGDTITLLKDVTDGDGVIVPSGKNFTLDFDTHTYTVTKNLAGSTGTKTQCFQLLKDSTLTFKNGTIKANNENVAMIIQNYSNLTLENMLLDGASITRNDATIYTMSNNCGNVVIKDTKIDTVSNGVAFDVYGGFGDYSDVTVTVTGSSEINGKIEVARDSGTQNKNTLNINGGTINGELKIDSSIKPGDATAITRTENVSLTAPSGYTWAEVGNTEVLVKENSVAVVNGVGYATLADALNAVKDGEAITLLKNAELPNAEYYINKSVTINGSRKISCTVKAGEGTRAFVVENNGSLTLDGVELDIQGTKNTDTAKKNDGTGIDVQYGGSLILKNRAVLNLHDLERGTISSKPDGSQANPGQFVIDNSTFNSTNIDGNISNGGDWKVTNGSTVNINNCGSYGLSVDSLTTKQSTVNASGTGYSAIYGKDLQFKDGSNVLISGAGTKLPLISKWSDARSPIQTHKDGGTIVVESGATVTVQDCVDKDEKANNTIYLPNNTTYTNNGTVNATIITADAPENSFVVTLVSDSETIGVQTVSNGSEFTLPAAPAKNNYTFKGWSDGSKTYKAGDKATITENTTFTAQWSYNGSSSGSSRYNVTAPKADHGTVTVSPKRASKGDTVTVTVKPDSGYVLETLTVTDKNGNELTLKDKGDGKYTFTMPRSAVTVKATFEEDNTVLNFFYDVPNDAYYYEAVKWAVEKGITSGIGNDLFGSNDPCTRAQIVTFLWRAAGSPEPKALSSFTDVPADAWYAKAVAWAVENGVTAGVGEGLFGSDDTCTRAQSVTFLFKALKATAKGQADFKDVSASDWYAKAVAWAVENGVTAGVGGGLFGSGDDCTRAQIVTFLFKAYQGK